MSDSINDKLLRGEIIQVKHKLYQLCSKCGTLVRINKPFIGSIHVCAADPK